MASRNQFIVLLPVLLGLCFSASPIWGNSYIGHNTIAIYIFYQLEKDGNFMPSVQGNDRKELIGKGIVRINGWDDLTNAQKAFIHGINFPDAFPLMDRIHQEMPQEILCAMYSLADKVPEVRRNEPSENKAFIKRMQRYMTWGAKIHLAMDHIAHAGIPDPRDHLAEHIVVETSRDNAMQAVLFKQMGFSGDKSAKMQALAKKITPFDSENYNAPKRSGPGFGLPPTIGNPGIDIRDEYVNLVLDFVKHGKDKEGKHVGDSLKQAKNLDELIKANLGKPIPQKYQGMPGIAEPTLAMLSKIDPTKPPTDTEMENQVNLDDPAMSRIGRTEAGRKLINYVGS